MYAYAPQIWTALAAALVVFLVYRRFRRHFGRQAMRPVSMGIRIAVFLVVGAVLIPSALRSGAFVEAAIAGLLIGAVLALWASSRTRFVRDGSKLFYIPDAYTGVAVSLLFIGRLVYRGLFLYQAEHASTAMPGMAGSQAMGAFTRSPLTLGMYALLMGYYVPYYALLLYQYKRLKAVEGIGSSNSETATP